MSEYKFTYTDELEFEHDLVRMLVRDKGWKDGVIKNPSEADLVENWARILYQNNNTPNRLNGAPLTPGEVSQLLEQVRRCRTPFDANKVINGVSMSVKRDNPDDPGHLGREISLEIYDRAQIGGGKTVYQIAEQPRFETGNYILPPRRGDVMLLINGLPVIHIELKRSGVAVSQAYNQIRKYKRERVFTGLFGLVQVFVAMNPEEAVYFANVAEETDFNERFLFHWAGEDNARIDRWDLVADRLLSIPMAHQLVGYYTVADGGDGTLKVMRSYQYYAASKIKLTCDTCDWTRARPLGGYVWHTTGSGKTLTSFKAAQLVASSGKANKVVFVVDRIELGSQSLKEYRGFASDRESVRATDSTDVLESLLADPSNDTTLIVTSIQKMRVLCTERRNGAAMRRAQNLKIVIIEDECHRSVTGESMMAIREGLPHALLFGFTGTPILEENKGAPGITTADVFGPELCHYTIASGIHDGNVLGFEVEYDSIYQEDDLRRAVALDVTGASSIDELIDDPKRLKRYLHLVHDAKMPERYWDAEREEFAKGIEAYVPATQYQTDAYRREVVKDIRRNWERLSLGGRYHAILATSSIPEAIGYYRLVKELMPDVRATALFDPNIDNTDGFAVKEDGLVEIVSDYNARYGKSYTLSSFTSGDPVADTFKKDVSNRLAHKDAYRHADRHPEECLDLLVVVDQMLTGFDSKWVNTLYLDKELKYAQLIQAFSRTNRVFGREKSFGAIRCYRKPFTMKVNVENAMRLYSAGDPEAMFVPKLRENLVALNSTTRDILDLFVTGAGLDLSRLPEGEGSRSRFALLWRDLNDTLMAARIQGFSFSRQEYGFVQKNGAWELVGPVEAAEDVVRVELTEQTWQALALRYAELFEETKPDGSGDGDAGDVPYDISPDLMRVDRTRIDTAYLEEKFGLWVESLEAADDEGRRRALDALHSQFSLLSAEDQAYAEAVIQKLQSGQMEAEEGRAFPDYINSEKRGEEARQLGQLADLLGCDAKRLEDLVRARPDERTIDLHGRYQALRETVDKARAREGISEAAGVDVRPRVANMVADSLLRRAILGGPFEVDSEAVREAMGE